MSENWSLPQSCETERLTIRAYETDRDVEPLHEVVLGSLEHLHPFIPWAANEPLSLHARRRLLDGYERSFAAGEHFRYAIVDKTDDTMLGGVSLHTTVGPDALEIGYWLSAEHEGRGIASESVSAVSQMALDGGAQSVEIWCARDNTRSAAVAARCGYQYQGERLRDGLALSVWTLASSPIHPVAR